MELRHVRIRVGVIVVSGSSILLVEHQKEDWSYWLIPGGGLDFGETVHECAKREMKEETNLDIELDKFLFMSESIAPDGSRHILNLFFMGKIRSDSARLRVGDDSRLKSVAFVELEDLDRIEIHPPFGPQLKQMLLDRDGQEKHAQQCLGNFWKSYPVY